MPSTATCPRCSQTTQFPPCHNCDGLSFRLGTLSDGSEGLICQACNLGFSHVTCQHCGALVSGRSFGSRGSRLLENMGKGLRAHQGTGGCFIATEIYGIDSDEVAILRRLRDEVLIKVPSGRGIIKAYYRIAPRVVVVMRRWKCLRVLIRMVIVSSVSLTRRLISKRP